MTTTSWFQSVVALTFAVTVPIGVGAIPVWLSTRWTRIREFEAWELLATSGLIGIPLTLALGVGAAALGRSPTAVVTVTTVAGLTVAPFFATVPLPLKPSLGRSAAYPVVGIAVALSVAAAFRANSPFPLHPAWDWFVHLSATRTILAGDFSVLPTELSDSFKANHYSSFFHAALGSGMRVASVRVEEGLGVSWLAPFVVLPLMVFAAARYAQHVLKSPPELAWAAAAGVALLQQWGQPMAGVYFLPASIVTVISLFAASAATSRGAAAGLSAAALMHPWMAILAGPLLIPRIWLLTGPASLRVLVGGAIAVTALQPGLLPASSVELNPFAPNDWPSYATPIREQWVGLSSSVTRPLLLAVAGLTTITGVLGRRTDASLVMLVVYLLIVVAPVAGTERATGLLPIFVTTNGALDVRFILLRFKRIFPPAEAAVTAFTAAIILTVCFAAQLRPGSPLSSFLDRTTVGGVTSSVSQSEIQVARLIEDLPERDTLVIVSDPDTQNIVGALAGVRSLGGGPFPPSDIESQAAGILLDPENHDVFAELRSTIVGYYGAEAEAAPILIIYSGRTEKWLATGDRSYNPAAALSPLTVEALAGLESARVIARTPSEILVLSHDE